MAIGKERLARLQGRTLPNPSDFAGAAPVEFRLGPHCKSLNRLGLTGLG